VKGLVELHGGTVEAASEGSGRGSRFSVRLPLSPAVLAPRARRDSGPDSARPRRVLLVEDNPMAARSLHMFLAGEHHAVEVAHSGPAGIAAARRFRPEVVLCDIGLPGSDGYELVRTLKREPGMEDVHWIAVTGYGLESDRRRAREAGFDRHLTKPVDLDELHAILAELPERAAPGGERA
jgi:CheY-like chemotaxis protein